MVTWKFDDLENGGGVWAVIGDTAIYQLAAGGDVTLVGPDALPTVDPSAAITVKMEEAGHIAEILQTYSITGRIWNGGDID